MDARIDLRSDTVTKPTDEMRKAMANAEVGDDVYGEDPTVNRLEELAAQRLGKEAALFVTSGTQGNQVAIAAHVRTGEEVIAEAESHIFYYEAAAISVITGAQTRQVAGHAGVLMAEQVKKAIRPVDVHQPRTALICVENTHNRAGGTISPVGELEAVAAVAKGANIPVHMDGARLFNAAVASGVDVRDIAKHVDTVQFCLSKGLGAPVGSLIVGSKAFIDASRQWRKRLGGGLRQAGIIAAPGIIALTKMVDRLAEDHENARHLATQLVAMDGVEVDMDRVQTNIVIADIQGTGKDVATFIGDLEAANVRATVFGPTHVRFVTHKDVTRADIDRAVDGIASVVRG